jgi:glycosyltransferase involved in cell wall biosynthesis
MSTTAAEPLIAVLMITYNHENFVEQAIRSIVDQRCPFLFKLYINDDCSTDQTSQICAALAKEYPEIIVYKRHRNNIGVRRNSIDIFKVGIDSTAPYLSFCEGDDYWTDTNKLAQQLEFLERHPEVSMVYTNCQKLLDGKLIPFLNQDPPPGIMDSREFILGAHRVPSCSVVLSRNVIINLLDLLAQVRNHVFHMDYLIWCTASKCGKIAFIDQSMVVYRVHSDSMMRQAENYSTLRSGMELNRLLSSQFKGEVREFFVTNNWWYYLEFAYLELASGSTWKAFYWFFGSLFESVLRRKKNQIQIVRDFCYRLSHRKQVTS